MKPVIKVNEGKSYLSSWIVEKFPENYREMTYLEPFLGSGGVLLSKDLSKEEVVNDIDESLMWMWRALRDENKVLMSKLKKVDCKESIFEKYSKKKSGSDYLADAMKEFILRSMSKNGAKKQFLPKPVKERRKCLESLVVQFPAISKRLENVFLVNKNAIEVIEAFSSADCLLYCDPPGLHQKDPEMDSKAHSKLGDVLNSFRGKAMISARNCSLYKRLYSSWNRKGVPGRPKESLWMNF